MRKLLLLAPVLLLASCRSEQFVFQANTVAPRPVAASPILPPVDSTLTATVVAPPHSSPAKKTTPTPTAKPIATPPTQAGRLRAEQALRPLTTLATSTLVAPAAKHWARHLQRQRPTAGPAESGLGGIAFFFIGVVLAVLAGLAALVNVIFGVGFFTALGYTAAGLVVLFLLYSLFSGGKKKK